MICHRYARVPANVDPKVALEIVVRLDRVAFDLELAGHPIHHGTLPDEAVGEALVRWASLLR